MEFAVVDEVTLNPMAALPCIQACENYIIGVNAIVDSNQTDAIGAAFGDLASGQALGQKFAGLHVGETYSLDSVLRQHIHAIEKLKSAFETAAKRYVATDEQNAATLSAQQADR